MKIAILVLDLTVSGGTQRQSLELANYLVKRGHVVKIYCRDVDKKNCYPELLENLDIHSLNVPPLSKIKRAFIPSFLEIPNKIVTEMDADFDIVNLHDTDTYIIGTLYKRKFNKKIPLIYNMNDAPSIFTRKKNSLSTLLFYLRGGFIEKLLCEKYLKDMSVIVVLDKINKEMVKKSMKQNAIIIRSGLDTRKFKYKKRNHSSNNKFTVLSVGILYPHRRLEDNIFAIYNLRKEGYNVRLKHIGLSDRSPSYAKQIYELVSELGLSKFIDFLGQVPEEELIKNYSEADAFVFPNYPQTWGLAVFEAMACGTPVIVSTGAGASEVLTNQENALLVPPKRPDLIGAKIRLLLDDEKLWKKLSVNGREFTEEVIRWDIYGEKMLNIFGKLI